MKKLDNQYKPRLNSLPTNTVEKTLKDVANSLPKVDTKKFKRQDKNLYDALSNHLSPTDDTLSKNVKDIPLKLLNKLIDKKYLVLPDSSKNTIKALLKEDNERLKPSELKLCQLPNDFVAKDKDGNQVGIDVKEANRILSNSSIPVAAIKDPKLSKCIDPKDIDPNNTVKLNKLTPSCLLQLDKQGLVKLDNDSKDLLKTACTAGVNYFKPLAKAPITTQKAIDNLDKKLRDYLPSNFDLDAVIRELGNIDIDLDILEKLNPSLYAKLSNDPEINLNSDKVKASKLSPQDLLTCIEAGIIEVPKKLLKSIEDLQKAVEQLHKPNISPDILADYLKSTSTDLQKAIDTSSNRPFKGKNFA